MVWITPLLVAMLAQQPKHDKLDVRLELNPTERVHLGDPLFVKVTITNQTRQVVNLPNSLFRTTGYSAHPPWTYRYSFHFESEFVTGRPMLVPIQAEEACTLDYEMLEFPTINERNHQFWHDIVDQWIDIRGHLNVGLRTEDALDLLPRASPSSSFFVNDRPPDETEFLDGLYAEVMRRNKERMSLPKGVDLAVPHPGYFGLASFTPYPDLLEKLLAYEERLSPGSLRDVVHLTGVMRKIYYSKDEAERGRLVDDLLQWLDALPEIERHCLAGAIKGSVFQWYRDQPAINYLVYEAIQRAPERLYEFEDYRAYLLRGFNHPGFKEYVRKREEAEQRP